ncbi:WD repeat-containing protein 19-like [Uloborus diversus]|uniref:WD repeat-containing protein 19-like n=1 Tax=Uloborus diversus TaxID=327109 RepID=UPI00240A4321|nr:WD repeat-containing protein 19-like [Uloborus diversus]
MGISKFLALLGVEDKSLLAGHISEFLLKNHEHAKKLYLMSSFPMAALEMCKSLHQWDSALKLAVTLSPNEVPYISRENAEQLELKGNYTAARRLYEKGLVENFPFFFQVEHHNYLCKSGIARTSLRCNDYKRGTLIANEINSTTLYQECASILEEMKVLSDAATLYEKGGFHENAAILYIKLKKWQKVKELLPNISSPKVLSSYAKAQEADRNYKEAAYGYETAKDFSNAIRIYLDHLKDPDSAVKIVKESNSLEGAKLVARFFQRYNDNPSAVKFLVLSGCKKEAFSLAQKTNNINVYADTIEENGEPDDYIDIAAYYEEKQQLLLAGKYYILAERYKKAVKLALQVSGQEEDSAIRLAINAASKAQNQQLNQEVIRYIVGDADGEVKDLQHLYDFYLKIGRIKEAAKTAVLIANAEQDTGTYRKARLLLLNMYMKLKETGIKIPHDMSRNLMLLHTYNIAKIHMQRGDHVKSAQMFIRVSNNIGKFPRSFVQILTTAVLECIKANFLHSANKIAQTLMRSEHKSQIPVKYKQKVEWAVRKGRKEDPPEATLPCPYCSANVPQTILHCEHCQNDLPYCIITGYHIAKGDLTVCPFCKFPATLSEFLRSLELDKECLMCNKVVSSDELKSIKNVHPENYSVDDEASDSISDLNSLNSVMEESSSNNLTQFS